MSRQTKFSLQKQNNPKTYDSENNRWPNVALVEYIEHFRSHLASFPGMPRIKAEKRIELNFYFFNLGKASVFQEANLFTYFEASYGFICT
jgi:hypothetical protein